MAFLSKRVARQCHRTVAGGGSSRIKPFFSSGRWLSAGANLKDSEELLFESADQHFKFLQRQAKLPAGFTSGAKVCTCLSDTEFPKFMMSCVLYNLVFRNLNFAHSKLLIAIRK